MGYRSINPATGELLKQFPFQSDAEVFGALKNADGRYQTDWKLRPTEERARLVGRAAEILREKREAGC